MMTESRAAAGRLSLNVAASAAPAPSAAPDTTALVLLHGVTRRWQDFVPLLPALAARRRVYALDFRGHGRSGWVDGSNGGRDGYRVIDYVADAVALLGQLDEPAVVYGHSLGAMVAAAAAAREPQRVRAVVLEDPPFDTLGTRIRRTPFHAQFVGTRDALAAGGADNGQADGRVDALARRLGDIRIPRADADGNIPTGDGATTTVRLGDVRDATALRFSARCLTDLDPRVLDPICQGRWLEGYDRAGTLADVRCPALLLQADPACGGMLPDADAADAAARLPRGYHVRLSNVGHLVHWAQPDTVMRLVNGFLESL